MYKVNRTLPKSSCYLLIMHRLGCCYTHIETGTTCTKVNCSSNQVTMALVSAFQYYIISRLLFLFFSLWPTLNYTMSLIVLYPPSSPPPPPWYYTSEWIWSCFCVPVSLVTIPNSSYHTDNNSSYECDLIGYFPFSCYDTYASTPNKALLTSSNLCTLTFVTMVNQLWLTDWE